MLKRVSILIITLAMLLNVTSFAIAADSEIKILINDVQQKYEQKPFITKGTTMVPLRAIFETLGAKVDWDGTTKTVTSTKGEIEIKLTIGKMQAFKNGQSVTLAVPAQIIKGSTYVPLRFVSESFGATVNWNGTTRTVTITTDKITSNINFVLDWEPTLDILQATTFEDLKVMNNINEGLFTVGPNGEYQLGMARDYQISADGLTWTFHLRDAKWSDGTAVTAQDFVYGITRASQSSFDFLIGQYVLDAIAQDDKTLVIILFHPISFFESLLTHPVFFPIKESFVDQVGDNYGHKNGSLSNGPFKVANWDTDRYANKHITLVKNEHYWDAKNVIADQVTLKIINDVEERAYFYQEGLLDMVEVMPAYTEFYENKVKDYQNQVFTTSSGIGFYLYFNTENKVLDNKNIRKAISWAINREKFVTDTILKPLKGLVPPNVSKINQQDFRDINGNLVDYNVQKAKEYLALGLKELNLTSLPSLTILYPDTTNFGDFLKEELSEIGIEITLAPESFMEALSKQRNGEFDLYINGWRPDYKHPMTFTELFLTNSYYNYGNWSNMKYEELILNSYSAKSLDDSFAPLLEAEKFLIQEEAVISPIYYRQNVFLVKPNLAGYKSQSTNLNYYWKWFYKH